MKKNFLKIFLLLVILLFSVSVQAAPSAYQKGLNYYNKEQYSKAIEALDKSYTSKAKDEKAQELLIKSYIARGEYFIKNKEFALASIDFRCALFYSSISGNEDLANLANDKFKKCCKRLHVKNDSKSRYRTAYLLELAEQYPAALYEYMQAAKDSNLAEDSNKKILELKKKLKIK